MITYIASLAAGNAIQVFLDLPEDTTRVRVLRKRADTIAAADDAGANVVFDGLDVQFIDTALLVNGTQYFYRPFYLIGDAWVPAPSRAITPTAGFADLAADVLDVVQQRLDAGLAVFVAKGQILSPQNHIPVLLATPEFENCSFPFVSVHMQGDGQSDRFIGESLGADALMGIGDDLEVASTEGWLSRYQILVIAWCTNGDVRNLLRKALKAVVIANLPIFEAAGMSLIEPNFSDIDDMNTYSAPMYQTTCTITCIAPAAVETRAPVVTDVEADFYQS
jgi:hypothetical protein